MNQEINNQTTLYRFVSLRGAELSKKEDQEKRFVFHPDNKTGVFFDAVASNPSGQSKWDAMKTASESFQAWQTQEEVEAINPEYFAQADAVMRSMAAPDVNTIYNKAASLSPLSKEIELKLWDNLFYQVITQRNFYVKEAVMQLLVFQHLLKQQIALSQTDYRASMPALIDARVVLPVSLFWEDIDTTGTQSLSKLAATQSSEDELVSQEILRARTVEDARLTVYNIELLLAQLKKIEQGYRNEYQDNYNRELKAYEEKTRPVLTEYYRQYNEALRKRCQEPRDINYNPQDPCNQPDIASPELPDFSFDYPTTPDMEYIWKNLSEDSIEVLNEVVNIKQASSLAGIKQLLEEALADANREMVNSSYTSEQVLAFGDTAVALKSIEAKGTAMSFQICTTLLANGNVSPSMIIQLPNTGYTVSKFIYHLHYDGGSNNTSGYFVSSLSGNVLTLANMYNNLLPYSVNSRVIGISGYIIFADGQKYNFSLSPFSLEGCYSGRLTPEDVDTGTGNSDTGNSFKPGTFGYRQLGIADYKKVVSKICCYEAGEVAHIENVMARELREKITKKFHQSQIIETDTTEIETEKINDTTSTERFSMQTEIAKMLQEDKKFDAHVNVKSSWGTTSIDAGASYASNVSKQESNKQSVTQAKEVTQRAMERIVSRVKNERTVKVTDEYTEENNHRFDNTGSSEHVSGVFRFINAIYKNQVYNYGKRLMYEFMVPQPSKLHRLGMAVSKSNVNAVTLDKPVDPRKLGYADFTKINESNYQLLAAKYEAQVKEFPAQDLYVGKSFDNFSQDGNTGAVKSGSIHVPDGYYSDSANANITGMIVGGSGWDARILVSVGDIAFNSVPMRIDNKPYLPLKKYTEEIPVAISITNFHTVNVTVNVLCKILPEGIIKWRKETFDAIIAGYEEQLRQYNEALSQAKAEGIQMLDSNPLFYRQIEQNILRENCISYLLDHTDPGSIKQFGLKMYNSDPTFTTYQVNLDQRLDDYGSFVKFMEQAFEWNLMSYNFYPQYWAAKDDWAELYQYESSDAIFRSFMQSGMARVIVTVKPGFESAIMHYITTGQIWNGGQVPVLGDPMYLSIVDELKEQEYVIEDTWTTVLPTELIALQKSGVAVDAAGLPCASDCESDTGKMLVENDAKMGVGALDEHTDGETAALEERVEQIESRMIENVDIVNGYLTLTTDDDLRQVVAQISVEALRKAMGL